MNPIGQCISPSFVGRDSARSSTGPYHDVDYQVGDGKGNQLLLRPQLTVFELSHHCQRLEPKKDESFRIYQYGICPIESENSAIIDSTYAQVYPVITCGCKFPSLPHNTLHQISPERGSQQISQIVPTRNGSSRDLFGSESCISQLENRKTSALSSNQ